MKVLRYLSTSACIIIALLCSSCSTAALSPAAPQYYSPLAGAEYVSTGATIIIRYGPVLSVKNVKDGQITVQGSKSGQHAGKTFLADDKRTIIFTPDQTFTPAEQVTVQVASFRVDPGNSFPSFTYFFNVAANQQPGTAGGTPSTVKSPPRSAFPNFLTVPQDIPHFTVSTSSTEIGEGDIFVAPFYWTGTTVGSYLLILNDQGQLVYYQSAADALNAFDFKVQPNGQLSYYAQSDSTFYIMDAHYQVIQSYQAGDGYVADLHDLQILPDGNALLMAYDNETVDMSQVIQGGKKDATVTGLIIQELDPSKNVIFEWRSWDHISYSDSTANLTAQQIDLVHGNALALANDGNLLLSSRNLSEITKIDLQTGAVIWRLGGKANMFTFTNSKPFAFQHDVRQLPNGDITIFDNQGTQQAPAPSLASEFKVDETQKTVTQVWQYSHTPPVFSSFMGNTQRLADGNTFLGWGSDSTSNDFAYVSISEVAPDGSTLFELSFDKPYVSYRAVRMPWQGLPDTLPALAYKTEAGGITLGYSWNGATEVSEYKLYGGSSQQALALIEAKTKTDFETQSHLTGLSKNECYFQVAAIDRNGDEMARSKVISSDATTCPIP